MSAEPSGGVQVPCAEGSVVLLTLESHGLLPSVATGVLRVWLELRVQFPSP